MTETIPRRACTLAEFGDLAGRMFVPQEIAASIAAWRPRPSDIVITPFAKCGTTWLQQTFHTLRTRGDMDFDDISRVVPWIETAALLNFDLETPQRGEPRGFKSHLGYDELPTGARSIVALRDPRDALVSMHKFMEGWFIEPGAISLEDFAPTRIATPPGAPNYWSHLLSWWAQRNNPDVLLMSYEHMIADPELAIRRVARFCGFALDDDLLALTLERTSIDFMLRHKEKFDDAMNRAATEVRCNLPTGSDSAKVRKGGVGGHRQEMSPQIIAALDARWAQTVGPVTGFATYEALEAAVRDLAAESA